MGDSSPSHKGGDKMDIVDGKDYWLNYYEDGTCELSEFREMDCKKNQKLTSEEAEQFYMLLGDVI